MTFGRIKQEDRILFAKNLSSMLKAGLPLTRAISVLGRQIPDKRWKSIFSSIEDSLSRGVPLSVSLGAFPKAFNKLFISMVASGEESGDVSGAFGLIAEELEKSHSLHKKVKSAMLYPAIIICLMLAIAILMLVYVLPKLTATFKDFGADLPFMTRAIIAASDFFLADWGYILIGIALVALGIYFFARSTFGTRALDKIAIKLPIVGFLVQETNSARTARTLSSLLSSGVAIVPALRITSGVVQNVHYKSLLEQAATDLERGGALQAVFSAHTDLYPPFVGEMIGVGEETGTLSKALLQIALFYEDEVDQKTKDMSAIIEPILMIVIGVGVGFFALAMISPIYSLSNAI